MDIVLQYTCSICGTTEKVNVQAEDNLLDVETVYRNIPPGWHRDKSYCGDCGEKRIKGMADVIAGRYKEHAKKEREIWANLFKSMPPSSDAATPHEGSPS
jgi:hypothetical protein